MSFVASDPSRYSSSVEYLKLSFHVEIRELIKNMTLIAGFDDVVCLSIILMIIAVP